MHKKRKLPEIAKSGSRFIMSPFKRYNGAIYEKDAEK